jgi:hypothetical protein
LKFNGTHQLLVHAVDDILWKHTYHKKAVAFISKETAVAINAEKTKYVLMFREQDAGQYNNIKIANKSVVWQS